MTLDLALRQVLARYPKPLSPLTVPQCLGNAGGLSGACFWRYDSAMGPLFVKAWPEGFSDWPRLVRIDRWLSMAGGLSFLAIPFASHDRRSFVHVSGRYWQISPWLRGSADLEEPPSSSHVQAGFQGLAWLHRHWSNASESRNGASPGLERRFRETDELIRGGFDRLERAVFGSCQSVNRELAFRWLKLARRIAPGLVENLKVARQTTTRLQPCIRDARRDHFLFEGDDLTGIVDFGAMDLESVAGDLARLAGDWLIEDRSGSLMRLALDVYQEIHPLDAVERGLMARFAEATALLAPGHWVEWHFVEGRKFEDPQAVHRGLSRGLRRLEAYA